MSLALLPSLFFASSETKNPDVSMRIVGKGIITGIAVTILFGPLIAAISVTAHFFFSYLSLDRGNLSWFAKNRAIGGVKKGLFFLPTVLKANLLFGLVAKATNGSYVHQLPLRVLIRSFYESPIRFIQVFSRITLVAPLIEEIIFRGFLQEKIRDVQLIIFHKDSVVCKIIRVVIQACIFAFCHFHPLQGLANIPILAGTFLFGFYAGMHKEFSNTLWTGMTMHAMINTVVCMRVILFGV